MSDGFYILHDMNGSQFIYSPSSPLPDTDTDITRIPLPTSAMSKEGGEARKQGVGEEGGEGETGKEALI
jgi:hypothetical protein